ncbi:hypothetical protein QN277_018336 [Acacia crassicarpa]|uniref:Reverse transcriptase domain-containing protein n=1 Tax=Acacia crassicarpa TaxID=499986 RepID=A0AAE1MP64_9FABA|nr:hypothetical protein QN277_018336 [Acacia crassicarpa]
MNFLIWNSRGTGARSFPALVRDLKSHYHLDFLAIVETRCAKESSVRRARQLGFPNMELIDCVGYSGGIWCFWDQTIVSISVLERHHQYIHLQVNGTSGCSWTLTVVYASPSCVPRRALWDNLSRLAQTVQGAWLLGGDFNGTLLHCERRSNASFRCSIDREFVRWVDSNGLRDIGFAGPEFTWKRGTSEARLDRILVNVQWYSQFPLASVSHLPFFKSDHRPLLLRLDLPKVVPKPNRPFRFIAAWALHEKFDDFVCQTWLPDVPWVTNISQFSEACLKWNKEVFRHTEGRKKILLRRIDGLNRAISQFGSRPYFENLQLTLWKELEDVLLQESLIWAQKARADWSVYGDRNTRYFHARANSRRKSQRIEAIKDGDGSWIYDPILIKNMATSFFSNLLSDDTVSRPALNCVISYPDVDVGLLEWCNREVSNIEIKDAFFSMGALKSPGPDGFNALFYQNQWGTVCPSVVSYIKHLFTNPQDIREVNGTLMVLIPKKDQPEVMGDLRPISLCNVVYKALSKIIVNRLKSILPQVVAPNQCSFVPGRHSSDNIIVAQEVIHTMRSMKQKKGYLAIKIDLEKAYDRVNWNFLLGCLREINLPGRLIEIIGQCVSSSSMQLLWNGDKADVFNPSRGVRQGDPLSPYLFVLCMEKLSHLIQAAVHVGQWKPIRLTRTGPPISHLFFADDIILFAEASMEQVSMITTCLNTFCASSGLKINQQKTRVYFSKNVHHLRRTEMCAALGFSITSDLGKYLGVPLHHKRVTKESFHYVVDKVKVRLSNWNAKSLSSAGRTTLISSVTSAIPSYVMQTSLLPANTCEVLDQCNRSFLWGNTDVQNKIPLVAWDAVCKPKNRGGLGLRHTNQSNQAFLMKIGWNMASRRDDFWVKVMRNKYSCGDDVLPKIEPRKPGSNLWSGIKRTWNKVREGLEEMPNGQLRWKWSKDGAFCVKSAYNAFNHDPLPLDPLWGSIWKIKVPERCKMFLWLIAHKRILTNAARCKRGLSLDDRCPICLLETESLQHVLRDCHDTLKLWQQIVPSNLWRSFCSLPFDSWLRWNLKARGGRQQTDEWRQIFVLTCWWLWRRRNAAVFEGRKVSNSQITASIFAISRCLNEAHQRVSLVNGKQLLLRAAVEKWQLPPPGWVKINTDGAFSSLTSGIASGGILRNDRGELLQGFLFKGDEGDSLTAELWGCLHGLKIAWDSGFRQAVLELDSAEAIALLRNPVCDTHEDRHLIEEVKGMLERDWLIEVQLISRWANAPADHLAKKSLSALPGIHVFSFADRTLERFLDMDIT